MTGCCLVLWGVPAAVSALFLAAAAAGATALSAQGPSAGPDAVATRQVEGGRMQVRWRQAKEQLSVDFPFGAAGKPRSLAFAAGKGDLVRVAAHAAGSPPELPERGGFGEELRTVELTTRALGDVHAEVAAKLRDDSPAVDTPADDTPADYRVSIRVTAGNGCERYGLVARYREGQGCYFFSVEPATGLVRIERWHGADHFVVRQLQVDALMRGSGKAREHTLSFEVLGFRLQAFVDDRPVLQVLDGGLPVGAPGRAWVGARPEFGDVAIAPPSEPLPSAAIVRSAGAQKASRATLYAAATASPGSVYVIELALDRPHPWVPRSVSGFEPWICQRPAAPTVLWAEPRGSLGNRCLGELGYEGLIAADIRWPDASKCSALRGLCALVRVQIATAGGERLIEQTPAVSLTF
ncbi:MAG: hypothetical protein AB8H80_00530 [Planctomycetota bacterium]